MSFNDEDTTSSTSTTPRISDSEFHQFQNWRDNNIRQAALLEGQSLASKERVAADRGEDIDALAKLTARGVSLRDAFGNSATQRGRDVLAILHKSSFATKSGVYTRLRRMAAADGLVK